MPIIPSAYEPQVNLRGVSSNGFGVRAPDLPTVQPEQNSFDAVGKALGEVATQMQQQQNEAALMDAQSALDQWELDNLNGQNGFFNQRGKNTFGGSKQIGDNYDKFGEQVRGQLKDGLAQSAFDKVFASRRSNVLQSVMRHEQAQTNEYLKTSAETAILSMGNRAASNYTDENAFLNSMSSGASMLRANLIKEGTLDESGINEKVAEYSSGVVAKAIENASYLSDETALGLYNKYGQALRGNDLSAIQKLITPLSEDVEAKKISQKAISSTLAVPQTKDEVINSVIDKFEGSSGEIGKEPRGAIAKYGINSEAYMKRYNKANEKKITLEDANKIVSGFTREQAFEEYSKNYWPDWLDKGDYPSMVKYLAYDMIVNGWDDKVTGTTVQQAVEQSGGDPMKLIQARRDYWYKLAQQPEYTTYLKSWVGRANELEAMAASSNGLIDEAAVLDAARSSASNDRVAEKATKLIQTTFSERRKAVEQTQKNAEDAAWSYIQKGEKVPTAIQVKMTPEAANKVASYGKVDFKKYNEARAKILSGEAFNLSDYRWDLGERYAELEKLQENPKLSVAYRSIEDVLKAASIRINGKATPANAEQQKAVDAFQTRFEQEFSMLQPTDQTAKNAQTIADRLLLKSGGMFGSDFLFKSDLASGVPEISGIPNKPHKVMSDGGLINLSYYQVLQYLVERANSAGLPATNDTLEKQYKQLIDQGILLRVATQ